MITSAGFYDRSIIGGGDRIMLNAFTGHYNGVSRKMPPMMAEDVRAFGARLTPLVGPANMSYTRGVVLHIWHGDRANRDYKNRYNILLANKYNPGVDVRINEAGVLEWATEKRRLHSQVTEYFNNRKEGPKATNRSHEDDVWTAQRFVSPFLGYHCNRRKHVLLAREAALRLPRAAGERELLDLAAFAAGRQEEEEEVELLARLARSSKRCRRRRLRSSLRTPSARELAEVLGLGPP